MKENPKFDVIIIGGSFSGLSAALSLGRNLRKTLVIDSGNPCNRHSEATHNFLTHDGENPLHLLQKAQKELEKYESVQIVNDYALSGLQFEGHYQIKTQSGQTYQADRLLFASGIKDLLPVIEGFSECWGKTIVHCPYCHGYEFREQETGIMANGNAAIHYFHLLKNLTPKITIYTNGIANFSDEQQETIQKHQIPVIEKEITAFQHKDGKIHTIQFIDQSQQEIQILYAQTQFEQNSKIPQFLGCQMKEEGYIQIDSNNKTNVPRIYACGDCTSPLRTLANAVSTGNFTAAIINNEINHEN